MKAPIVVTDMTPQEAEDLAAEYIDEAWVEDSADIPAYWTVHLTLNELPDDLLSFVAPPPKYFTSIRWIPFGASTKPST